MISTEISSRRFPIQWTDNVIWLIYWNPSLSLENRYFPFLNTSFCTTGYRDIRIKVPYDFLRGCSSQRGIHWKKWKRRFCFLEKQLKSFQPTYVTSMIQTDRKKTHSENTTKAVKQVALNLKLWKMRQWTEIPLFLASWQCKFSCPD